VLRCFCAHPVQAAEREACRLLQEAASQQQPAGSHLGDSSTRIATDAAARHEQRLRQDAAAAAAAGQQQRAAALQVLATALRLKFCAKSGGGSSLCNKIVLLSLLLVALQRGTGMPGHIDPAAAVNYAFAVVEDDATDEEVQQRLQQPLACWLFVSPAVFTSVVLLRQLLWLVDDQRQRQKAAKKCRAALDQAREGVAAAKHFSRRRAATAHEALAAAKAALQGATAVLTAEQLQQRWREAEKQQQVWRRLQKIKGLSSEEERQLEQLLGGGKGVSLGAASMQEVAAFMGSDHAVLLEQSAGQGIQVKVG
jgi:hypothetical protein